jgi:hypothetical protein
MEKINKSSPLIQEVKWGLIVVSGLGRFRDVKLYPGGGCEWDWCKTNTHHDPGIQIADVEELLSNGAEHIVLSRGMLGRLKIEESTVEYLKSRGIKIHITETNEAVAIYNKHVQEGKPVGGLFHSTC